MGTNHLSNVTGEEKPWYSEKNVSQSHFAHLKSQKNLSQRHLVHLKSQRNVSQRHFVHLKSHTNWPEIETGSSRWKVKTGYDNSIHQVVFLYRQILFSIAYRCNNIHLSSSASVHNYLQPYVTDR